MTRLEDVLRAGLVEQEARAKAAATGSKVKKTENKVKQPLKPPSKPPLQSDIAKRKPAGKPSEDVLESLRYMMMTSAETLDRATGAALEHAATYLPAPTSRTAWCLLQWIFVNKFLEESGAVPKGTFTDFYAVSDQIMCYIQFSEDTEEARWEDFVDLVDGSTPPESDEMDVSADEVADVSASMGSVSLSDLPEIGVRMPLRGNLSINEGGVIKEKWQSFKSFVNKTVELTSKFVAYANAAFGITHTQQQGGQVQADDLPAGLEDPEDMINFMQGNAGSFFSKITDVLVYGAPAVVYKIIEKLLEWKGDSSVLQDDAMFAQFVNPILSQMPTAVVTPIDPSLSQYWPTKELTFFKELLFGQEGVLSTLNFGLLTSFDGQMKIKDNANNIRAQFKQLKELLGSAANVTAEYRQYMFFISGLAALLRWFLVENRKRVDRFAKANGEALRVFTHAIVRKYVRGREVFLNGDGRQGAPLDPRRNQARWLAANRTAEQQFLNKLKKYHNQVQKDWASANEKMNKSASAFSGMLSGVGANTVFSTTETVASIARIWNYVPGTRDVITVTRNVVQILSYLFWRHSAKKALEELNAALEATNAIKPLLEEDPQGLKVIGLKFRTAVTVDGRRRPGGGRWALEAAWDKRPRVLKGYGVAEYIELKSTDDFGDDDDLIDLSKAVVPYAVAAATAAATSTQPSAR